ncbi:FAD-binding and (Fe-S)-binding domain-containing protein [Roseimaritima sediminicola]|uniref:FAD-binding and (Fe-S)-binding domain-containing protein n=1 Tax=Roseimaritima sediminicola TaxID=2662066 RepID=UPI00129838D5|nr:FAD-binding and (Fe-S)-binding domain-containing protein [Roseimaritima sediminicola]
MDVERQRIEDDLRGTVAGDVLCDDVTCQLYASDASIYQLRPLGVVRPRSTSDVATCVRYAAEHHLTLHARGAGSGVAGEALGRGLVLDFSSYMRRWQVLDGGERVRLQPGVTLAVLNRDLQRMRRMFGPDPATRSVTTMGSVIAVDASGSHFLRYGSARDAIESVQVVTSEGKIVELSQHSPLEGGIAGRFAAGVQRVLDRNAAALEQVQMEGRRLRGGYRLDDCRSGDRIDLAKLLTGSEGTLGLITEATMRTEAIPTQRGVALLFFHRLDAAARGASAALRHGVVACDLMDRRLLEIAREMEPRYEEVIPRDAEAMLLVEVQGEALPELRDRLAALVADLTEQSALAYAAVTTVQQSERDMYWRLCRRVVPRVYRLKGNSRALPFVEDLLVPPQTLPDVLTEIQAALQAEQTTAFLFAHAGHGQLHVRPFLDLAGQDDQQRLRSLSQRISEVAWRHGGTLSAEHASGLSRSWLLPRQYGELWRAMPEMKRLFDPHNRFNPGKITGATLQQPHENLRPVEAAIELGHAGDQGRAATADEPAEDVDAALAQKKLNVLQVWPPEEDIDRAARQCNGCGRCRTTAPEQRQCPVFRAQRIEEASPRAKANLLRGVLTGDLDPEELSGDRGKAVADLCFNCHQCRLECPASVNIPKIVNEIKGQYVATNGLPVSDMLLCRLDTLARVMSRLPWLSNHVIRNRFSRWLLERLFGLSAARRLPPLANRTLLRYAGRRKLTRPVRQSGPKVVYFMDYFTNYHDTSIGRALIEVLLQNRVGVYVPPRQVYSGMSHIAAGDLKTARKLAVKNIRLLADAIRQGHTVVATEPSAVLCLQHEYLNLVDDDDARLVAENSYEACRYLWDMHGRNELTLDFRPVSATVAYHQPCHVRAIDRGEPGPLLMDLIPGLTVKPIHAGCSGMAGLWGLQKQNYRNSLRIGWPLISAMRSSGVQVAASECTACRMQIEHGVDRPVVHPIKLLAYAYGRMPDVGDLIL